MGQKSMSPRKGKVKWGESDPSGVLEAISATGERFASLFNVDCVIRLFNNSLPTFQFQSLNQIRFFLGRRDLGARRFTFGIVKSVWSQGLPELLCCYLTWACKKRGRSVHFLNFCKLISHYAGQPFPDKSLPHSTNHAPKVGVFFAFRRFAKVWHE